VVSGKYTIKEMSQDCQPRERLLKHGSSYLSEVELLAILINTGYKYKGNLVTAIDLAHKVLSNYTLEELINISPNQLQQIPGIGKAKSASIKAAFELSRRIAKISKKEKHAIKGPKSAANYLIPLLRFKQQEHFVVLLLDAKNQIIRYSRIHIGTANASLVHPRDIFKKAISHSAVNCIIAHNHPSGDTTPSREDIAVTERMIEVGKIVGIEIIDHIIIGNNDFLSFKKEGLM